MYCVADIYLSKQLGQLAPVAIASRYTTLGLKRRYGTVTAASVILTSGLVNHFRSSLNSVMLMTP